MTRQPASGRQSPPEWVDLSDPDNIAFWRDRFGITIEQLQEAVQAVGRRPQAVREHLLNQGASAGAS